MIECPGEQVGPGAKAGELEICLRDQAMAAQVRDLPEGNGMVLPLPLRNCGFRTLGPLFVLGLSLANGVSVRAEPLPGEAAQESGQDRIGSEADLPYRIRKGDTLNGLSHCCLTPGSQRKIAAYNRLANPDRLLAGSILRIPRAWLKTRPIGLTLLAFSGPVQIRRNSAIIPARTGQTFLEGDLIETGAGGFIAIATSEGAHLTLPSNSRVRVFESHRIILTDDVRIDFRVEQGRGEFRVNPQRQQDRFLIKTPVSTSAIRGTILRVKYDGVEGKAVTEVIEGKVAVATGRGETLLPGGYGLAVDPRRLVEEPLLPTPALERPGAVQTAERIEFSIAPQQGARAYRAEIARDAGFLDVLAEQLGENGDPRVAFTDLPDGTYFVRVAALAESGLESPPRIYAFRRQRLTLSASAERSDLYQGYRFAWSAQGKGRKAYRFQLFGAAATPLVDEAGLSRPGITLTGLSPGDYRWRVAVEASDAEGSALTWGDFQTFTIAR